MCIVDSDHIMNVDFNYWFDMYYLCLAAHSFDLRICTHRSLQHFPVWMFHFELEWRWRNAMHSMILDKNINSLCFVLRIFSQLVDFQFVCIALETSLKTCNQPANINESIYGLSWCNSARSACVCLCAKKCDNYMRTLQYIRYVINIVFEKLVPSHCQCVFNIKYLCLLYGWREAIRITQRHNNSVTESDTKAKCSKLSQKSGEPVRILNGEKKNIKARSRYETTKWRRLDIIMCLL